MRNAHRWCRSAVLGSVWLVLAAVAFAQPPGFPGRGPGGRGGGFGDPNSFLTNLRSDEFRDQLDLSDEQNEALDQLRGEIRDWFGEAFRSGMPPSEEDRNKRMAEFDAQAVKILNDGQRRMWERRKTEIAQASTEGGGTPAPANAPAAPPVRFAEIPNTSAPDGESAMASFQATGNQQPRRPGDEPVMSFNFRYAPWADVLKLFAETAGLTLDLQETPTGTFNYYDDRTLTVTEALDVLNGYLLPKGYVLVRRDRFLVCWNIQDTIPPNLVPDVSVDELAKRGDNELLRVVIPLDGVKASDVSGEVQQLLGPLGKVAALGNTNSLVIQDIGVNVRRVYELLKASMGSVQGETAFKSIPLKHISASDAERMVRRLFGLNPVTTISTATPMPSYPTPFGSPFGGFGPPGFGGFDRSRGGDDRDRGDSRSSSSSRSSTSSTSSQSKSPYADKIWVTADTRTNHLLVTAPPELLRVVENAVTSLDTGTDANGRPIVDSDNPVSLKVYSVTGNATQIAQSLAIWMPGLAIVDDPNSGRLHIQATADEHDEVERLLQQLDGDGSNSVAVISLYRLDPVAATNSLRNLFVNEGTRAPSIEADAAGRRLMIRGTPDQVAQVRALLAELGETGEGPTGEPSGRGPVRTYPLGGRDPAELIPLLRQMWSASSPNPIRIVVPSQSSPIRDLRVPSDARLQDTLTPPSTSLEPEQRSSREAPSTDSSSRPVARNISYQAAEGSGSAAQPNAAASDDELTEFLKSFLDISETPEAAAEMPGGEQPGSPGEETPVGITVVGDDLVLTSTDTGALDQMERMLEQLSSLMPVQTKWTVFYLRSADATETAQMLERLFPQSSVTTSTQQSDGLFGSLAGGLSTLGRGMMNATGLNYTLGGQTLRIVTDLRSNALFVTGPATVVAEVEQMLRLLDASELPTSLKDRLPRAIAVEFADIDEVASIVQNVFQQEMTASESNARQSPNNRGGFNPLAMMMGATQNQGRSSDVKLTIGVDRQTSHLIVSCNDSLFRQVEDLVLEIDSRARAAQPVVRVMPLATADPIIISDTLSSLIPKVTVSSTRSRRPQPTPPSGNPGGSGGSGDNNSGPGGAGADMMRQMFEQRMRERMSGGDSNRGPSGFGPPGGFGGPGGFRGRDGGSDGGDRGGFFRGPR